MYMLNALERHHKVVTTSEKLKFSLSPEFSSWGRVSKKKKKKNVSSNIFLYNKTVTYTKYYIIVQLS